MADLNAQDKLKQICDVLRVETLKPAEKEADVIIRDAKERAKRIVCDAQEQAEKILAEASKEAADKISQGELALVQAGKRSIESLKQAIETKILKESLVAWLDEQLTDTDVAAKLIAALVQAIEQKGLFGDLIAYVGQNVSARSVNQLLSKTVLSKLENGSVTVGTFPGGVQLKILDKNLVLDLSSEAVSDLLIRYLQHDFRKMIFQDI